MKIWLFVFPEKGLQCFDQVPTSQAWVCDISSAEWNPDDTVPEVPRPGGLRNGRGPHGGPRDQAVCGLPGPDEDMDSSLGTEDGHGQAGTQGDLL